MKNQLIKKSSYSKRNSWRQFFYLGGGHNAPPSFKELNNTSLFKFFYFSNKPSTADLNDDTKFFQGLEKSVDNYHFVNHTDSECQEKRDPRKSPYLKTVNTEVCEQLFNVRNKFRNCKKMNEGHFLLFFTYIFDLHNLKVEENIRSIAHLKSEQRYEIKKAKKEHKNCSKNVEALDKKTELNNLSKILETVSLTDLNERMDTMNNDKHYLCADDSEKRKGTSMLQISSMWHEVEETK